MSSEQALNFLKALDREATNLGETNSDLENGFVALGFSLLEAAEMRYWQIQYKKFRAVLPAKLGPLYS